jgi:hypothetical protein
MCDEREMRRHGIWEPVSHGSEAAMVARQSHTAAYTASYTASYTRHVPPHSQTPE